MPFRRRRRSRDTNGTTVARRRVKSAVTVTSSAQSRSASRVNRRSSVPRGIDRRGYETPGSDPGTAPREPLIELVGKPDAGDVVRVVDEHRSTSACAFAMDPTGAGEPARSDDRRPQAAQRRPHRYGAPEVLRSKLPGVARVTPWPEAFTRERSSCVKRSLRDGPGRGVRLEVSSAGSGPGSR